MNPPDRPPSYSSQSFNPDFNEDPARCPTIHPSCPTVTPDITTCPDFPANGPPPAYEDAMDPTFFQRVKDLIPYQSQPPENLSMPPNRATKTGRQLSRHFSEEDTAGTLNIEQEETSEASVGAVAIVCVFLIFSVFLFVIPFPEMIVGYKYMDLCNDWFSIWLCVTGTVLLVTWIYVFLIFCLGINTLVLIVINIIMLVVWWSIGMYWCWISPTPLPEYKQPPKYKQRNFGGFFMEELYLEQFEYNVCIQQFYFVYALCWVHLSLFTVSIFTCSALFVSVFRNKNDPTDV